MAEQVSALTSALLMMDNIPGGILWVLSAVRPSRGGRERGRTKA